MNENSENNFYLEPQQKFFIDNVTISMYVEHKSPLDAMKANAILTTGELHAHIENFITIADQSGMQVLASLKPLTNHANDWLFKQFIMALALPDSLSAERERRVFACTHGYDMTYCSVRNDLNHNKFLRVRNAVMSVALAPVRFFKNLTNGAKRA